MQCMRGDVTDRIIEMKVICTGYYSVACVFFIKNNIGIVQLYHLHYSKKIL